MNDYEYAIGILNSTASHLLTPDPDEKTGIIPDPIEWKYDGCSIDVYNDRWRRCDEIFSVHKYSHGKVDAYHFGPYEMLEFLAENIPRVKKLLCIPD